MLCGFTIQNVADTIGGGIRITDSSPRIENSVITNNTVISRGGGIFIYNSNSYIQNNEIINNSVYPKDSYSGQGGGVYISFSGGMISNTRIINNFVDNCDQGSNPGGGGIRTSYNNTIFKDLYIYGNYSGVFGGGILQDGGGQQTFINTQVLNNYGWIGGGICNFSTDSRIYNSVMQIMEGIMVLSLMEDKHLYIIQLLRIMTLLWLEVLMGFIWNILNMRIYIIQYFGGMKDMKFVVVQVTKE